MLRIFTAQSQLSVQYFFNYYRTFSSRSETIINTIDLSAFGKNFFFIRIRNKINIFTIKTRR